MSNPFTKATPFDDPDIAYLRDYFAGQAIIGLMSSPIFTNHRSIAAETAYLVADEMLKVRAKPAPPSQP